MYSLKKLLDVTVSSDFVKEYKVEFNPRKIKWMSYPQGDLCKDICLRDKPIEKVGCFVHLGYLIDPNSFGS